MEDNTGISSDVQQDAAVQHLGFLGFLLSILVTFFLIHHT
jgi:hypothetical protein